MNKYLFLILLLFFITRVYKIGQIPPSLYWDEASIGYNAYSILTTLKDEWGDTLPVHVRAFGEFKLPVYIYSVIPAISLFGLNEASVRIPAVIFTLTIIIIIYKLSYKLFDNQISALFSSFIFSISPWFFIFSRTGYEVTAGLMFYLLAVLFVLQDSRRSFLWSIICFILSVYSYNSFRIIVPLTLPLVLYLKINLLKKIIKSPVYILSILSISILALFPLYRLYFLDHGISRLNAVGGVVSLNQFFINYFSHLNPDFLFLKGDFNLRSQLGMGEMYYLEAVLFISGLLYLVLIYKKNRILFLVLTIISLIPGSITKEAPHALRAALFPAVASLYSGAGVFYIYTLVKDKSRLLNKYFYPMIIISFIFFFAYYYVNFLTSYPFASSQNWQFGYKQIFTNYKDQFNHYDRIIISDEYAQPYIFMLFYLKYDPENYRNEAVRNSIDKWGFSTVGKINQFIFSDNPKNDLTKQSGRLLIFTTSEEKLEGLKPVGEIKFLDGNTAFLIYDFKK